MFFVNVNESVNYINNTDDVFKYISEVNHQYDAIMNDFDFIHESVVDKIKTIITKIIHLLQDIFDKLRQAFKKFIKKLTPTMKEKALRTADKAINKLSKNNVKAPDIKGYPYSGFESYLEEFDVERALGMFTKFIDSVEEEIGYNKSKNLKYSETDSDEFFRDHIKNRYRTFIHKIPTDRSDNVDDINNLLEGVRIKIRGSSSVTQYEPFILDKGLQVTLLETYKSCCIDYSESFHAKLNSLGTKITEFKTFLRSIEPKINDGYINEDTAKLIIDTGFKMLSITTNVNNILVHEMANLNKTAVSIIHAVLTNQHA